MTISPQQHRQAFAGWLRTGWWRVPPPADDLGLKFNPNHDPHTGRFTFGGGGASGGWDSGGGRSSGDGASASWPTPSTARTKLPQQPTPASARAKPPRRPGPAAVGAKPTARQSPPPLAPTIPQPAPEAKPELRREVRNGYTYRIDVDNRTREVSGELHTTPAASRSRDAQRTAGGTDRRPTDHGGHYIAARFDGPTDAFNHFAQDANFNVGSYRVLENQWAKELGRGKHVFVSITPIYVGTLRRPDQLRVTFSINGQSDRRKFHNERQGKLHGKRSVW